jgi:hypothetical protein
MVNANTNYDQADNNARRIINRTNRVHPTPVQPRRKGANRLRAPKRQNLGTGPARNFSIRSFCPVVFCRQQSFPGMNFRSTWTGGPGSCTGLNS